MFSRQPDVKRTWDEQETRYFDDDADWWMDFSTTLHKKQALQVNKRS
jgi:hypothetical protein